MHWMAIVALLSFLIQPVSAALKKCVDDEGKYHYYDKILPPECQNKMTVEMNRMGVVIKQNEVQERSQSVDEKYEIDTEHQKNMEETRRDAVLLNIYTSVDEIDLARERNVQPVELAIVGIEKRLEIVRAQLEALQQQAKLVKKNEFATLAGIKEDMSPIIRSVANLEQELIENQERIKTIEAKFDTDKKRFLELRGK